MALAVTVNDLRKAGIEVTVFDARKLKLDFPGAAPSPDAAAMTKAVAESSGVIIATPEYHGSFAAMTKLMIENLGFPSTLRGKAVGLVGVASGRIGAIKSLEGLKGCLSHVGGIVIPNGAVSIAGVQGAFDAESGACKDAGAEAALVGLSKDMQGFLKNFVCPRIVMEEMVRQGAIPDEGPVRVWTTSV